jgi:hypothetical protein
MEAVPVVVNVTCGCVMQGSRRPIISLLLGLMGDATIPRKP